MADLPSGLVTRGELEPLRGILPALAAVQQQIRPGVPALAARADRARRSGNRLASARAGEQGLGMDGSEIAAAAVFRTFSKIFQIDLLVQMILFEHFELQPSSTFFAFQDCESLSRFRDFFIIRPRFKRLQIAPLRTFTRLEF